MSASHELIGSADAERILGISRITLRRWIAAGKLPIRGRIEAKGTQGAYIYDRAEIERIAAERKASS